MEEPKRNVRDAEIVDPGGEEGRQRQQRQYGGLWQGGSGFTGFWTTSAPLDAGGCSAPGITIALFLICLAQYGLLAGIGFLVFNVVGALLGSVYQAKQLMAGVRPNVWAWRVGVWIVAFTLTIWLAGGFK